jgi:hypothetical protein
LAALAGAGRGEDVVDGGDQVDAGAQERGGPLAAGSSASGGPARPPGRGPLTAQERNAFWEYAARVAAEAAAQIRADPAAADGIVWAASDALHVAAAALGSRILRLAADAYDRAARAPDGRIPTPSSGGNRLREAARIMSAFAYLTGDRTLTPVILITRLAALAEAVAWRRETQQRAAQAAAGRFYAAAGSAPASRSQAPPRARTAAGLAATSFPGPPVPSRPAKPAPGQHGADQRAPRPARRPPQPRPRGPTR